MQQYADQHGLRLRPHTKTHKSRRLAAAQLERGAVGLTVAKVSEAETMADLTDDLLIGFPVLDRERARHVADLARDRTVRLAVDSATAVDCLATAAANAGTTVGILVDIDVGMHRTGVQSPRAALDLARHVASTPACRLDGLFCYPGHIRQAPDAQATALHAVADILQQVLELYRQHGLHVAIVSGGSTPTACQAHCLPQLTEIRPGTYIFNDVNTVRGGFCDLADCAATVLATVVSTAVPGKAVVDAGSKTLTSDPCLADTTGTAGFGHVVEQPDARIVRLSEEHGEFDVTACKSPPTLGQRLRIIPNHVCPCINLHDQAWWLEPDQPPTPLSIDGRGRVT